MKFASALVALLASAAPAAALAANADQAAVAAAASNPIRKVVTMLQDMQKKVTEEGKKEEEAYDKFMCYCSKNGGALSETIEAAKARIEALSSSLKQSSELKTLTEANLQEHQASRAEAEETMAQATAMREKEAAAFSKVKSDSDTNIAALKKAIAALDKGMSGTFLQTTAADTVRRYAMEKAELPDQTREELLSFLSATGSQAASYSPQGGEISGILKQLQDEMTKSLGEASGEESAALANFEGLIAAKKKEVATLQAQIEEEMRRVGELGMEVAQMNNDQEDTKASLTEDEKFQMELETSCKTKSGEWEAIKGTRAEELVALAETIKVLNDDDALDLFKKALPSASSSFLQVQVNKAAMQARALTIIRKAKQAAHGAASPALDLIALALKGKKIGFEKVIAMVDEMVENLKKEQVDDDSKKKYCGTQLDHAEDKKKAVEQAISDSEAAIDEATGAMAQLVEEIKALEAGIKALDKSVAEATELRKEENADYKELMASDSTAKEVLVWAKNRLNKFYNPKLYKAPPKRELSEEERITVNMGGSLEPTAAPEGIAGTGIGAMLVQVSAHNQRSRDAPPPPPETFGAYTTKSKEGNGVVAMIDLLVRDLDKEMQEADVMEKDSQKDYETLMEESSDKRAADAKAITEKASMKASAEERLEVEGQGKAESTKELMGTAKYIQNLHEECDWLLQYFETRKEARASEIESLGDAKAVLKGADYSFMQRGASSSGFLARRA